MTRNNDLNIDSEDVRLLDKESPQETEVEVFAEYRYDGEWIEYSFWVDYEQYLDKERLKGHAEMWARKKKVEKVAKNQ